MAAVLADPGVISAVLPLKAMAERGALHALPQDGIPNLPDGTPAGTLVLLGWQAGLQWEAFAASPEIRDGHPHPLDRWSRRLIDHAAAALGASALYPFGGPPHHDFQRWALRAEPVSRSPIGLLIHPGWGLWHAYRGALAFGERLPLLQIAPAASPCETCLDRTCLSACPAKAFSPQSYDVAACAAHVRSPSGDLCLTRGCAARRACPEGPDDPCAAEQTAFHMNAFLRR